MARPKRNIKFNSYLISYVQQYMDATATINEYNKRYYYPELAEFIEFQNGVANSLMEILAKELHIKGKADLEQVEQDYEYYNQRINAFGECSVKPEYRKDEE